MSELNGREKAHFPGCWRLPDHHECALERIKRLGKALMRYGQHVPGCRRLTNSSPECTCNLMHTKAELVGDDAT